MARGPFARRDLRAVAVILAVAGCVVWSGGCIADPQLSTLDEPSTTGDEAAVSADGSASEAGPFEDALPTTDADDAACLAACPAAGGTCEAGTCVLACPGVASCATGVTCPPGIPCRITCTGEKSCKIADCGNASTCQVECIGKASCEQVRSLATQTSIACTHKDSCPDTRCDGTRCTVQCNGDACKLEEIKCCAQQCTVNGRPGRCN